MAQKKNEGLVQTSRIEVGMVDKKKAAKLLGQYRNEGLSTQHDLFPSLNKALIEAGEGASFFAEVMGEVTKDAVPSTLQPGEFSDTIILKEIGGEEQMVVFYASNKGAKAKLNGFKKGAGIMVLYRGKQPSQVKGFNEWNDFGIEEFKNAETAIRFKAAIEAA